MKISEMFTDDIYALIRNSYSEPEVVSIINNCLNQGFRPKIIFIIIKNFNEFLINKSKLMEDFNIKIETLDYNKYKQILEEEYPIKIPYIIGVTGSSGKTSVLFLLYQILVLKKMEKVFLSCSFATGGSKLKKNMLSSMPFSDLISNMSNEDDYKFALLECTSHALEQNRIGSIGLDVGIFINIQENHLDYHETMSRYIFSKLKILENIKENGHFIINRDIFINQYFTEAHQDFINLNVQKRKIKIIEVNISQGEYYNLNSFKNSNIVCAILILSIFFPELTKPEIENMCLDKLLPSGRDHLIGIMKNNSEIIVDGAHNFEQISKIIQLYCNKEKKLIVLYGIAGHRITDLKNIQAIDDLMRYEDKFFIVDDNPQIYNAYELRNKISTIYKQKYKNYSCRFDAIIDACDESDSNILILGKATEVYNYIQFQYENFYDFFHQQSDYLKYIENVDVKCVLDKEKQDFIDQLKMYNGVTLSISKINNNYAFNIVYNEIELIQTKLNLDYVHQD